MKYFDSYKDAYDYYKKLYDRADENYAATGDGKYDKSRNNYGIVCDALENSMSRRSERDRVVQSKQEYIAQQFQHLYKQEYTKDEVKDLIRNAVLYYN